MTPVELINLSLLKIGVTKGISAVTEDTREAWTALQIYDHYLRLTLRSFPWPFATKYAVLTLTKGPVYSESDTLIQAWSSTATYEVGDVVEDGGVTYWCILANTNQDPPNATYWTTDDENDVALQANHDWKYAYRWPTDCLFARRFVREGIGRGFDANPPDFRVGRDKNGLVLYINEPDLQFEYTVVDCDNLWTDDLWLDAFTWNLASLFAPSLAKDKDMTDYAWKRFLYARSFAALMSSKEGQQPPDGEAAWISARN